MPRRTRTARKMKLPIRDLRLVAVDGGLPTPRPTMGHQKPAFLWRRDIEGQAIRRIIDQFDGKEFRRGGLS